MEKEEEIMNISRPFANVMGLFFPIGKLENGGTCEFATSKCLKKCCAHAPGSGKKIGFDEKRKIYTYFLDNSSNKIATKILYELQENNCKIFTWFASGDCPSFLVDKYFNVILELDKKGIVQTGFTRNRELWERCSLFQNSKILLTMENIDDIIKYSEKEGLYSIPNYKIGAIDIYKVTFGKKYKRTGCGGGYYQNHIKDKEKVKSHLKLDCKNCYENGIGCFSGTES